MGSLVETAFQMYFQNHSYQISFLSIMHSAAATACKYSIGLKREKHKKGAKT